MRYIQNFKQKVFRDKNQHIIGVSITILLIICFFIVKLNENGLSKKVYDFFYLNVFSSFHFPLINLIIALFISCTIFITWYWGGRRAYILAGWTWIIEILIFSIAINNFSGFSTLAELLLIVPVFISLTLIPYESPIDKREEKIREYEMNIHGFEEKFLTLSKYIDQLQKDADHNQEFIILLKKEQQQTIENFDQTVLAKEKIQGYQEKLERPSIDSNIGKIEHALRKIIHEKLSAKFGEEKYWDIAIPENIRAYVTSTIIEESTKMSPAQKTTFLEKIKSNKEKLEFLTLSNYQFIIKNNYDLFIDVFGEKDLAMPYFLHLVCLCNLRDSLNHNREYDTATLLYGVGAIEWLKIALNIKDGPGVKSNAGIIDNQYIVQKTKKKQIQLPKLPSNLKWEEITIKFLNGDEVQITARDKVWQSNYELIGFRNEITKNPNRQWDLLKTLSLVNGFLNWDNNHKLNKNEMDNVKKRKQELSETLKIYFNTIKDDPFFDYKKENGYKIKIQLIPEQGSDVEDTKKIISNNIGNDSEDVDPDTHDYFSEQISDSDNW